MIGSKEVVDSSAEPVLKHLLDEAASFHPEYHGGLSNHLPMALMALYGLGGSAQDLLEFYRIYIPRLETLSAVDTVGLERPSPALGTDTTHLNYLRELSSRAQQSGFDEARRHAIDELAPGIGAAAFHGLIRTAYGLEQNHLAEELVGFAYWSQRYLPLAQQLPQAGPQALGAWFHRIVDAVHRHTTESGAIEGDLIHQRMRAASQTTPFVELLDGLDIEATSPLDFARLAAHLYFSSLDFTVLHLVTSAHALEIMSHHARDSMQLRHWYAVAFAAAAATVDQETFMKPPLAIEILNWPEIRQRAISSMDDHVIKLSYTLSELEKLDEDPIYLKAASSCVAALKTS